MGSSPSGLCGPPKAAECWAGDVMGRGVEGPGKLCRTCPGEDEAVSLFPGSFSPNVNEQAESRKSPAVPVDRRMVRML